MYIQGHRGWVTSIATHAENPNLILSSSRDKTVLVWQLQPDVAYEDTVEIGYVSSSNSSRASIRYLSKHNSSSMTVSMI